MNYAERALESEIVKESTHAVDTLTLNRYFSSKSCEKSWNVRTV